MDVDNRATRVFVVRGAEALMIRKERDLDAGKINGLGGRIDTRETPSNAPRATCARSRVSPPPVSNAPARCRSKGIPRETDEAFPPWTPIDAIAYDEMWADDRLSSPRLLAGKHSTAALFRRRSHA